MASKVNTIMKKRTLGNSGLEVSAMGLGCMGLTFGYIPFVVFDFLTMCQLYSFKNLKSSGAKSFFSTAL